MNILYAYKNCDTCRKALRFLRESQIPHDLQPIRETPPTAGELRKALQSVGGDIRRLFNTSGADFRQLDLKTALPTLSEEEAIALLSGNGNLVKCPLLIGEKTTLIGFNQEQWQVTLDDGDI